MAALRNLVAKIPGAAALRSWRSTALARSSLPKSDIENALLVKQNIKSAKVEDLHSSTDLLAHQADQTVEALSQVSKKHEAVAVGCATVSMKFIGSAVLIGCINSALDHYWNEKATPELEFLAAPEDSC